MALYGSASDFIQEWDGFVRLIRLTGSGGDHEFRTSPNQAVIELAKGFARVLTPNEYNVPYANS